jgi:RNA polymerase primary sigma factor
VPPRSARRRASPPPRRSAARSVGSSRRADRTAYDRDARIVARAKRGDRQARQRLVDEHMGLVRSTAHRYRGMGVPFEDLVQEGVIGLLEAIDRFDPANGAAFSTYAFWRVRQTITRALTDHGRVLRLPKEIVEHRRAISRALSAATTSDHTPTSEELAELTHLSRAEIAEALAAPTSVGSLDEPLEDGSPLAAAIADPAASDPEARAVAHEEEVALGRAVSHLSPRQREVVTAHFGLGREAQSLAQVGASLHVSAARARALERDALYELALELEPALDDA